MRDDDVSDDVAAAASAVAPPPRKLDIIDPILSDIKTLTATFWFCVSVPQTFIVSFFLSFLLSHFSFFFFLFFFFQSKI